MMAESAYTVHAIVKMKSRVLDSILTLILDTHVIMSEFVCYLDTEKKYGIVTVHKLISCPHRWPSGQALC